MKRYKILLLLFFAVFFLTLLCFFILSIIFSFYWPELYFVENKSYFFFFILLVLVLLLFLYLFSDYLKDNSKKFFYWAKTISSPFTWFYTHGYFCIKSGFYLDFYFKKLINSVHKQLNYYLGLVFLDKYILNKFVNKFFINFSQFNDYIIRAKKKEALFLLGLLIVVILSSFVFYLFIIN